MWCRLLLMSRYVVINEDQSSDMIDPIWTKIHSHVWFIKIQVYICHKLFYARLFHLLYYFAFGIYSLNIFLYTTGILMDSKSSNTFLTPNAKWAQDTDYIFFTVCMFRSKTTRKTTHSRPFHTPTDLLGVLSTHVV